MMGAARTVPTPESSGAGEPAPDVFGGCMHTVIVMGGGFALLLACLLLGYAFGDGLPGLTSGAKAFLGDTCPLRLAA